MAFYYLEWSRERMPENPLLWLWQSLIEQPIHSVKYHALEIKRSAISVAIQCCNMVWNLGIGAGFGNWFLVSISRSAIFNVVNRVWNFGIGAGFVIGIEWSRFSMI